MIFLFLNELTQNGYRIFSVNEAKKVGQSLNLSNRSVHYILQKLTSENLIKHLFRGSYAISDNILSGSPIHAFEIASYLSKSGAICCWSALAFHGLTDQVLSNVYVYAPIINGKKRPLYEYNIDGLNILLIQTDIDNIWGIKREHIGESKIPITDLQRTLIDCLEYPQYCGGFREALHAFDLAKEKMDIVTIVQYAQKGSTALQKRLGWVLDQLGIPYGNLSLENINYYDKLDPSGPRKGKYNKKWMVIENF